MAWSREQEGEQCEMGSRARLRPSCLGHGEECEWETSLKGSIKDLIYFLKAYSGFWVGHDCKKTKLRQRDQEGGY